MHRLRRTNSRSREAGGLSTEPGSDGKGPKTASETVLGDIVATARLDLGSERVRLLATTMRLIVAHIGKRGTGAMAASPILGRLSGGLEELLKGGLESRKKRTMGASSPDELLADKDNFYISYDDIIQVELEDLGMIVTIMILTKDRKFQFVTLAKSESVIGMFHHLANRVTMRHSP